MTAPECTNGKHSRCAEDACTCHCHDWEVPLDPEWLDLMKEE